jgi:two-component system response regulator YesN
MPGISGLELIQKAKERKRNIHFIIISGYAEFAYAQKALNYGALGYCLKPFDGNEIHALLDKARKLLESENTITEVDFLSILEEENTAQNERIRDWLGKIGVKWNYATARIVIGIGKRELGIIGIPGVLSSRLGINKRAYLVPQPTTESPEWKPDNAGATADILGIGVSRTIQYTGEMSRAIEEAETAAYDFFIAGRHTYSEYMEYDRTEFDRLIHDMEYALLNHDIKMARRTFGEIEKEWKLGRVNIKMALFLYNSMISALYRLKQENREDILILEDRLVSMFPNMEQMLAFLYDMLQRQFELPAQTDGIEIRNVTFREILSYVNHNFFEEISLQSISVKFKINLSYLSRLFRKETGSSFTEYLMNRRISYACQLLEDTPLTINQIAEKVGYSDYFYFTKVFRRVTGFTPTAYRQSRHKS